MPATSPYTQNDYAAVSNYRPYQLPVNDIYKAIDAQNKFWDQGAARVKNVYENALSLDLTVDSNIEIRKNFMDQAQKQMVKLSSMDLSDPSVQRQGFGIFKPLLQDKGIIYDDFLTKKRTDVINEAEKWKNDEKTKGEGYNIDNLAYALRPFKDFSNTTSREQLESIFKGAKNSEYVPYYDVSKERLAILDKCKPNSTSNTTTQGMYLETNKISSLSSQKLWGCLEAGLSDHARQQIRISGVVRYGDDYNTLKGDYIATAKDKLSYYTEEIKDLSVQKAALSGKKGYEDRVKALQDQIDEYTTGVSKLNSDITTYGTWDDDYMKKNYEDLATLAYFKRANGAFADAFAKRDIEQSKKADPVGMMYYTQQKLDDRQAAGWEHDYKVEDYKMKLKLLSGEGTMDDATRLRLEKQFGISNESLTSTYGTAVMEPGTNYDTLNNNIALANTNIDSKAKEIISFVQKDPDLAKVVNDITNISSFASNAPKLEEYVKLRLKLDPNDIKALELKDGLNAYIQMVNEKIHHQSVLDNAQNFTEQQVDKNFGDKKTNIQNELQSINSGQPFPLHLWRNGDWRNAATINITPQKLIEAIQSGQATISRDAGPLGEIRVTYGDYKIDIPKHIGYGSDIVGAKEMRPVLHEIVDYLGKNQKTNDEISSFRHTTVNNYLEGNTAVQKMKFAAGNLLGTGKIDDPKMTPSMRFISSMFGSTLGEVQFNTVGGFDPVTGWTDIQAVTVNGKDKGSSIKASKLMDAASESQFGASIYEESKYPNAIRVKIPYLSGILQAPSYNETLNELITYASSKVTKENIPEGLVLDAGITPSGNKVQLKTTKSLATGIAKHTILINGVEIPIKIGNDAASTMNYISKLLTGQEDKQ